MEGYDLFSDDLPSLGSSMLDGLAELGGTGAGTDQSQYPTPTNQGQGQSHGVRASGGHYYGSYLPPSGVLHH